MSIKWNSLRLGGPAHGIVTKTVQKTLPGAVGVKEVVGGLGVEDLEVGVQGVLGIGGIKGVVGWMAVSFFICQRDHQYLSRKNMGTIH